MTRYQDDQETFVCGKSLIPLIFVVAIVLSLIGVMYLGWQNITIKKELDTHERALSEMAGVIVQGGLVVADKDGNPQVNTILLEAWKQVNPQP